MIYFRNDYSEGAHPKVMEALVRTNMEKTPGYGADEYCGRAAAMIRSLCKADDAAVHFMSGGTQVNKTTVAAFLRPWECVIGADCAHIHGHECASIENDGHQIVTCHTEDGKLTPELIEGVMKTHCYEHTTVPRLVYISNTTEWGTVYSAAELRALHAVCRKHDLLLYCDGARLAAAMAAGDTTYTDYALNCDAFTIGGTKNGLLFGEALVVVNPALTPYFRNCMKQQGSILAKGRLFGVQYETILTDDLYLELGKHAYDLAVKLRSGLLDLGCTFHVDSPSNQLFLVLSKEKVEILKKSCAFEIIEEVDAAHDCIRFVTSWATTEEDVDALLYVMSTL